GFSVPSVAALRYPVQPENLVHSLLLLLGFFLGFLSLLGFITSQYVGTVGGIRQREAFFGAAVEVGLSDRARQGAHAQDVTLTLGHGNRAAGIQQVKGVRGFQYLLVSGQRQAGVDQTLAVFFVLVERHEQEIHVGVFKVVGGLLHFVLMKHIAVGNGFAVRAVSPHQVVHGIHFLQVHGDTLKTVGDFAGDRETFQAAHLLEVGELGYFHAVQP